MPNDPKYPAIGSLSVTELEAILEDMLLKLSYRQIRREMSMYGKEYQMSESDIRTAFYRTIQELATTQRS